MIGKWVSKDSNFWTSWVTQSMEFIVSLCTLYVGVGCFLSTLCSFSLSLFLFFLIIVPKYKLIIWSTTCNCSLLVINSFPTHYKQNLTIFFVSLFLESKQIACIQCNFLWFYKIMLHFWKSSVSSFIVLSCWNGCIYNVILFG